MIAEKQSNKMRKMHGLSKPPEGGKVGALKAGVLKGDFVPDAQ